MSIASIALPRIFRIGGGASKQLPDVLAQKAVETGYAMMHKKPVADTVVLIPAELLTRESPPESTEWGQ